jgi:hypothetical protein
MRDAVHALVATCEASVAAPPSATPGHRVSAVEGAFSLSGSAVVDGLAVAAVRRTLAIVPLSDWRTDEDEVAVVVVGPSCAMYRAAPVRFPIRPTGGSYLRRVARLAAVQADRAVVVVQSPFADKRGWGNDNYALGYSPRDDSWVTYREERGRLVVAQQLRAVVDETELTQLCFGEAIVWCEGSGVRVVVDDTPYHLDGVEPTRDVRRALDARAKTRGLKIANEKGLADVLAAAWPAYDRDRAKVQSIGWDDQVAAIVDQGAARSAFVWFRR